MSLATFHRTLTGASNVFEEGVTYVGNYALGGRFSNLTNPNMVWYNGSTYSVSYASNTYNNQVYITKQTGYTVESYTVGSGTTAPEPDNHPTPMVLVNESTGYIYVIQNEFHVDPFRVWRSNSPEDISAFTLLGTFDTDGAYLMLLKQDGLDCTFVTRSGGAGAYDQNVLEVNLNTTTYTDTKVTDTNHGTTGVRHYPVNQYFYGTSDYRVGGILHRQDSPIVAYKVSLWVTQDFDTYENIGQTFSKDVTSSGELTATELETNFAIIGTDSDQTTSVGAPCMIQINDDVYLSYSSGSGEVTVLKYTIGTATAVDSYVIPVELNDGNVFMYYNGNNIVLTLEDSSNNISIYTMDLAMTSFEFQVNIDNAIDNLYLGLPMNLGDIPLGSLYLIIGRSELIVGGGTVPYIITNKRFLI